MTRESRLIVILLVMAGAGVIGLMFVAKQYRNALAPEGGVRRPGETPAGRAARLADGFLAARAAARSFVADHPGVPLTSEDLAYRYRFARAAALAAHRMTDGDYARV